MKQTIRKALALFMTIALVATTITFTAGNTLQAEEQAPPEVSQETSEPAKADAPATTPEPEKSEPVKETQTMNISQDEPDDEDYEPAPADNEKKNPANEKKDNDKDKEKKKFHDSKADLDVSVTAPAEAFPEGTSIKLTETDFNSIKRLIQNHYGSDVEVAGVQAVDISFVKSNGKSTKPSKNVDVTISGIDISGENMALFHISGNRAEYVKEVSGTSVSFSAGSFSPYAIASYGEKDSYKDDDTQNRAVEVYVNTTTTLTGGEGYNHKWKIKDSDKSVARINSTNKNIAIVKGVSEGSVTITHEYKRNGKERTETFTVTVLKKQVIQATDGEITGAEKVEKYKTISLNLTLKPEGAEAASCIWYSSDDSILTVDNSGKVTGVSEGTATVTAQVTSSDGKTFKVTKRITVTEATGTNSAMFFYLKTPTSDPASNSVDQWGDEDIGQGKISTSNLTFDGINAWISSDPGRVISWPAGFDGGNVPRDSKHWKLIYDAFSGTVGAVNEDDVEAIILHPYKISNNKDGYHVDCTVELRVKKIYTATYYLWDAGETGYRWKFAENVRDGKTTSPSNASEDAGINNLPDTKTVKGRTYRLITWHDNAEQNGSAVEFPYTMTKNTNFYAKYIADYIVSYDLDGGTVDGESNGISKVTKPEGEIVSVTSKIPEKAGHNFIGWQCGDAVYKGGATFTMPASDVTLKALWERQYEVVITADSGTKTYNGDNQSIETFKVNGSDSTFEYKGEKYTVVAKASGTGKDVGDYGVNIASYTIKKGSVDVTAMFNVRTQSGELTITPAPLTVTTPDASKVYDGTPLEVKGEGAVTVTGIVDGETYGAAATGSQTEVGSSSNTYKLLFGNSFNTFTAKASNYEVVEEDLGRLEVTEYAGEIVVTTTGGTFIYDGEAHGATVSVSTLPTGYTLETATSNDTATHVAEGTVTANCDTLVIKNAQGVDVTSRLNIKRVDGSITITPATLTVTTPSDSKVYDGDPFTAAGSITGFVKEETATFATTGTQTEVGNSKNTYSITWNKTAVESDYTINETIGTLTVTENADEIVVTTTGGTFTYDGKPHKATVTVSTLPKGYTLETATSDDTATHVAEGTVTANCDTLVIKNAQRVDVTSKLNITYVDGSIKINPATLTITTPDASKVYDGTPLTAEGSITGFVNGETAKFTTTGSQTTSGSRKNTYKIDWEHEATTASESNYTISESVGTLTVSEYAGLITVTTTGGTFTYDGEAHGATVEVTGLPEKGYTVETATSNDKATHVADGTVEADCDALVIRNAQGDDVTDKLNIEHVNGNITINPATLTVITQSASKVYDSKPLTAGGSIKGFVEGENAKFTVTGSQTAKGSSKNTYEIEWDDENTRASDYLISEQIGTLTVTENADEIVVTTTGGTFTYDGKVHRAKVSVSKLPKGYTLVEAESTARAKNVTEEPIAATADVLKIVNADGLDVTKELKIKYVDDVIRVNPRSITVTSASATKQYDGTPLTANSFVIGGDGMAEGESLVVLFGDGQTEIGKKENDFQILGVTETSNLKAASQLEAEDVSRPELDNYDITTVFGTLTVTAEANLPAAVDNGDNGENGGNGNNGGTANPDGLVAGDGYNVTTIGNGQTPLANSLLDLNCCILHLLIMLAAMLMLIWYTHDMKKRQRKIFNLEEQLQELE